MTWESGLEIMALIAMVAFQLSFYAALAAVGITMVFLPLQMLAAKRFSAAKSKTTRQTDLRVRHISEVIDGIASVKSYGWEIPFFKLISSFRDEECRNIQKSNFLRALNLSIYFCSLSVSSFAAFSVFWALGGKLGVSKVFSTLSLLQALRNVFYTCTRAVQHSSNAIVNSGRIEIFLTTQDIKDIGSSNGDGPPPTSADTGAPDMSDDVVYSLRNTRFLYPVDIASESSATLTDISFDLRAGELLMVVGPVGAGKSSLLSSLLGELEYQGERFYVCPRRRIALCVQKPWLIAATARANICMAGRIGETSPEAEPMTGDRVRRPVWADYKQPREVDEELYALAVNSTMLAVDFLQWTAYDRQEIGARGISVSGGQKARLALARAVYSDADGKLDFHSAYTLS